MPGNFNFVPIHCSFWISYSTCTCMVKWGKFWQVNTDVSVKAGGVGAALYI